MKEIIDKNIEKYMKEIKNQCHTQDERLYTIFEETYLDTLKNALKVDKNGNIFVLTGDIPAMWQRDSAA